MIPAHFITFMRSLSNSITSLIKRCALTRTARDNADYQLVQAQYLGHVATVESASIYGLSSSPPLNSTGIVFNILANEENRAAFFNIPQARFKNLKPWEVQIGNYLTRSSIKFAENKEININSLGDIEITSQGDFKITINGNSIIQITGSSTTESTENMTLKAPQITLDGNVIITGDLDVSGDVVGAGVDLKTHVHSGVSTGTENTGPPV